MRRFPATNSADVFCFLLLAVQTIAWRLPFLGRRISSDPSIFAYISREMLQGAIPYRDLFDNKAPFIYFAGALFGDLANDVSLGYWIMEAFFVVAAAVVVHLLLRGHFQPATALLYSSLFILFSNVSIFFYFTPGFVEYPAAAFTASAYLLTIRASAPRWHALAGVAVLLALMSQQISLVACAPIWLWLLAHRRLPELAWHFAGLAGCGALVLGWFFAHDALDDFIYAAFRFNFSYVQENPATVLGFRVPYLLYLAAPIPLLLVSIPAAIRNDGENRLIFLWLLAAAIALVPTGLRLYAHYYVILAAPMTLALAHAWAAGPAVAWTRRSRHAAAGSFVVLLALGTTWAAKPYFVRAANRLACASIEYFENPYRDLARLLNAYPFPDGRREVLLVGFHTPTEVAMLTNTRMPGSFTHPYCIFGVPHPRRAEMTERWVASVKATKPRLVVQHRGNDPDRELPLDLGEWVRRNYEPLQELGDLRVLAYRG